MAVTERLPALGAEILAELDVDPAALGKLRRPLSRCCIDWTEQRPHIGGALGAALLAAYKDRRWVMTVLDSRRLEVTPQGRAAFIERFGLDQRLFGGDAAIARPRAALSTAA